jgi:transposase
VSYFAQPSLARDQFVLIPTTLDDAIPETHEVRLLDEILRTQDWSTWEAVYSLRRGQPPIPPRVVASVILYGLLRRIRSSRVLEYMTGHNVDFLWLTEGRTIDHATLCKFRTRFKGPLKQLFLGLSRMAMTMGLIRLGEVTFDGTRVKANNGRSQVWTAAAVEKRLAELEAEFGRRLEEGLGQHPEAVLADGLNATGPNIVDLAERGVEFLSPPAANERAQENPAVRSDLREPVPEAAWERLPISPQTKKLDKSCFVFVPEEDIYYCPQGRALAFEKTKPDIRQGQKIILRVYRCGGDEGCPLAGRCISAKSQGGRTITRDIYTADRERHAAKMRTPEAPGALRASIPCGRDAVRLAEAGLGAATVPVAWAGKGPDGVAVGVYRLQPAEVDRCGGTTAHPVRPDGCGSGKLRWEARRVK